MEENVVLLGRFPPPIDGQSIATERLASLLEPTLGVSRVDVGAPENHLAVGGRWNLSRARHYVTNWQRIRGRIAASAGNTIIWTSISPSTLGHFRDRLTTISAMKTESRVLAVVHHGDFHVLFERRGTRRSALAVIKRLAGIVFLSQSLADRCAEWIPEDKLLVIPNTISQGRISTTDEVKTKQAERATRKSVRVLFVGNMIPSKGYVDVLKALPYLVQRGLDVQARFAGRWPSGTARDEFNALIRSKDLEGAVIHEGSVEGDEAMKSLYAWADLVALPSYYPTEAQPLVLVEAMANGTPVISSHAGSIPEMVRDGEEGVLIPTRSPIAIADAISELSEPGRWTNASTAAFSRFRKSFSPEHVGRMWLEAIASHGTASYRSS